MTCDICDENEATMKISSVKLDGEVWDTTHACYPCAREPASELCLILPPRNPDAV